MEYIREFEQLEMIIGLNKDNELTIARFIKGLSPSIGNKVELQPYLSFKWCSPPNYQDQEATKG